MYLIYSQGNTEQLTIPALPNSATVHKVVTEHAVLPHCVECCLIRNKLYLIISDQQYCIDLDTGESEHTPFINGYINAQITDYHGVPIYTGILKDQGGFILTQHGTKKKMMKLRFGITSCIPAGKNGLLTCNEANQLILYKDFVQQSIWASDYDSDIVTLPMIKPVVWKHMYLYIDSSKHLNVLNKYLELQSCYFADFCYEMQLYTDHVELIAHNGIYWYECNKGNTFSLRKTFPFIVDKCLGTAGKQYIVSATDGNIYAVSEAADPVQIVVGKAAQPKLLTGMVQNSYCTTTVGDKTYSSFCLWYIASDNCLYLHNCSVDVLNSEPYKVISDIHTAYNILYAAYVDKRIVIVYLDTNNDIVIFRSEPFSFY
jgi:hypothetical protein